jgi:hypothetical protein
MIAKLNGPIDDTTSITYSFSGVGILFTRLLIVDKLFYSNVEWYADEPVVHA